MSASRAPAAQALTRRFTILNQYGIHARPAAMFVKTASRFEADVMVERDGNRVPGKSIMGLLALQACSGSTIVVTVEGTDAAECMDELAALIEAKFNED